MTQKRKTRKKYTKEFKLEALKLGEEIGVAKACEDLGISDGAFYKWRKAAQTEGTDAFRGNGRLTERDEELRKLRQENKVLKQEREILKKATAFFAGVHR
jgi:transposase